MAYCEWAPIHDHPVNKCDACPILHDRTGSCATNATESWRPRQPPRPVTMRICRRRASLMKGRMMTGPKPKGRRKSKWQQPQTPAHSAKS